MFKKENLYLRQSQLKKRVILYSLRFGGLAGLPAFKPDPPSMSTYCPQTTTGQLTHKECSSATALSSMRDQGVPLKGQEACARLGNITAALKILRRLPALTVNSATPDRGSPCFLGLAPSSAVPAPPRWGLPALGHSNSFKCFRLYRVIDKNYHHWSGDALQQ